MLSSPSVTPVIVQVAITFPVPFISGRDNVGVETLKYPLTEIRLAVTPVNTSFFVAPVTLFSKTIVTLADSPTPRVEGMTFEGLSTRNPNVSDVPVWQTQLLVSNAEVRGATIIVTIVRHTVNKRRDIMALSFILITFSRRVYPALKIWIRSTNKYVLKISQLKYN